MADLHAELTALEVTWPETPDLAGAVAARLAEPAPRGARGRRRPARAPIWRARLLVAYGLAAVAAAFAITMAVSPDARSAVLEFLGLKSVAIERREPDAPRLRPGTLGAGLGLGTPVTLDEARARLPFLRVPAAGGLGQPDAVYVGDERVALVYGDASGGADVLVQEFPARVEPFIQKSLGGGAELERLRVDGAPAYFITGSHGFAYDDGSGGAFEDQRLAGNTLLVERADGLLIRVEGDLARDRAVAIADSIPD